jgi:hypothetical protein
MGIEGSIKNMLENNLLKGNDAYGGESEAEYEEYKPSSKNKPFKKPHPT